MSDRGGWLSQPGRFEWEAASGEPGEPEASYSSEAAVVAEEPEPRAVTRGEVLRALRQFGHESFRPHQEDLVRAAVRGRDVLAVLPTGGGKSLCYQLPALVCEGLTVVVSPLVALMRDQVEALIARGLPATALNGTLDWDEQAARVRDLGRYKLVYVSPERLVAGGFLSALRRHRVRAVVVDEAHCISTWGHDFRPEFREVALLRREHPEASFSAFTASATQATREDVARVLELRDPYAVVASFNRPNLTYRVRAKLHGDQVHRVVLEHRGESGIVYALARRRVEQLAEELRYCGVRALAYHADLDARERERAYDEWMSGRAEVVVATIAFGMGVDKPDVRFVIHADVPRDVEGYYQETGRAGRDGKPSECVLFYDLRDAKFHYSCVAKNHEDPAVRQHAAERIAHMARFAETWVCRRRGLLGYFGESFPEGPCGACDVCLGGAG